MPSVELLVLIALSIPTLAIADEPAPPPPAGAPQPPPDPSQPPPPPPGYQQPVYAPPPAYQPPPQQPGSYYRQGVTFEANIGFGLLYASSNNDSDSKGGVGGISLGLGGWVNERLAVTARFAPTTYHDSSDSVLGNLDLYISNIFLGPSLQYWIDDHAWVGGGAGLGIAYAQVSAGGESDSDSRNGFGLDLRAGYTFTSNSDSTINVSAEITPSFFSESADGAAGKLMGFCVLFGYQHL